MIVELNPKIFRPGTKVEKKKINFILKQGGLGDYIGFMSAIVYAAEHYPNVEGDVYVAPWFIPVAQNVLWEYHGWAVRSNDSLTEAILKDKRAGHRAPFNAPINRTGAHAVDLGFIYYLNMTPPPAEWNFYPQLELDAFGVVGELAISKPYAVMTPGASNLPKTMPASTFNAIAKHLIENGIEPVFLGNTSFREAAVHVSDGYDFSVGTNLIGKTSLLEAAHIMKYAKCVVGIDNGLLHLAAMTDVNIVYGYTISSPEHTTPRRKPGCGKIYNIFPDTESLTCTFCQSRMRLFFNHDFKDCLYKDAACSQMYLENPEPWCDLIDEAIKEKCPDQAYEEWREEQYEKEQSLKNFAEQEAYWKEKAELEKERQANDDGA